MNNGSMLLVYIVISKYLHEFIFTFAVARFDYNSKTTKFNPKRNSLGRLKNSLGRLKQARVQLSRLNWLKPSRAQLLTLVEVKSSF